MLSRDAQATKPLYNGEPTKPTAWLTGEVSWRVARGATLPNDRYVLERQLGFGGMAAVWLAHDRRLDRPVAIKILSDTLAGDDAYVERIDREAHLAAQLSHHPNLVTIYDFDARERPYLVMEYVEGGDLGQWIEAEMAPDPDRLARDLLAAIDHIHAAGVIHRDIKPQNVLIGSDGRALLTDFGIALPRDATSLTRTGMVLGTEKFMAPEVREGAEADERSDLYSLGVTLAAAIEGREARQELEAMIERLQATDPAKRPPSAAAELRDLEDRLAVPAPVVGPPTLALDPAEPVADPEPIPDPLRVGPGGPLVVPLAQLRRRLASTSISRSTFTVLMPLTILIAAVAMLIDSAGKGPVEEALELQKAQGGKARASAGEGGSADEGKRRKDEAAEVAVPSWASGEALNDQGFDLIQEGQPEEAVPVLVEAVDELAGTGDITYAYALYNLGWALRLAGRPEEAIPILEQRLEIPNQLGVVKQQLELARAEAGLDSKVELDEERGPGAEGRED